MLIFKSSIEKVSKRQRFFEILIKVHLGTHSCIPLFILSVFMSIPCAKDRKAALWLSEKVNKTISTV